MHLLTTDSPSLSPSSWEARHRNLRSCSVYSRWTANTVYLLPLDNFTSNLCFCSDSQRCRLPSAATVALPLSLSCTLATTHAAPTHQSHASVLMVKYTGIIAHIKGKQHAAQKLWLLPHWHFWILTEPVETDTSVSRWRLHHSIAALTRRRQSRHGVRQSVVL